MWSVNNITAIIVEAQKFIKVASNIYCLIVQQFIFTGKSSNFKVEF